MQHKFWNCHFKLKFIQLIELHQVEEKSQVKESLVYMNSHLLIDLSQLKCIYHARLNGNKLIHGLCVLK